MYIISLYYYYIGVVFIIIFYFFKVLLYTTHTHTTNYTAVESVDDRNISNNTMLYT